MPSPSPASDAAIPAAVTKPRAAGSRRCFIASAASHSMIGEFLRRVTAALDMNGVPYMLTGSLASSMYGIPRATNDIDIVIAPTREQLVSLVQLFQRVGLNVAPETALAAFRARSQFNVIDFPRGLKTDLILRKEREFS